ncbi:MAG: Ribosomal small subunit methyltransferase [Gammaproteobacteria bacterium]|jgi:16S rRNA (guanine527-N7)-methyltransferase|nr:Ribosomal small subunit methyltransferase [Gammaproteobacteria bacterium]
MLNIELLQQKLCLGLQELKLTANDKKITQLLQYLSLLIKWNKAYNLTAIDKPEDMVILHLLDSLALVSFIHETDRYIDVGTGAGLPGIPLAIWHPNAQFTLLDSNSKKTRFLVQASHELGLNNITVVNSRVEKYKPEQLFDAVLSRAFSSLNDMLDGTKHLCRAGGQFLAMKGVFPKQEIEQLPKHYSIESQRLKVPFLSADRHVICIINQ